MRTALVTGTSRGIGREIVRQLRGLDWKVVALARNTATLEQEFGPSNDKLKYQTLDMTREEDAQLLVNKLEEWGWVPDVLIQNAGIMSENSNSMHASETDIRSVFEVNYFGIWRLNRMIVPLMKDHSGARVIHISSGMGAWDDLKGDHVAYRLSKNALNALSVLMAEELFNRGIGVHSMCPGWVKTDMGGQNAPRPVEKGAETAIYLSVTDGLPTGRFWRDKRPINW